MDGIQRLLCTHCTFGTSALEITTADNAAKVLGYSVRKSSLPDSERGDVRTVFRAVERLLSYQLPKDSPAGVKDRLDADSAPRRLVFLPNLGGWQVAAQVAYRTHDTAGRPGSYFADVLAAKAADPRQRDQVSPQWSPVEVLRLLDTGHDRAPRNGWWIASEAQLTSHEGRDGWHLQSLAGSPESLRGEKPPLIDDALLRTFLTAEAGEESDRAQIVVPPRWWRISATDRRALVEAMLQSTIRAGGGRETVVVAAEPSVAALLFYAVCRLLPDTLAKSIGFSTYEPEPDRALTQLVATTFLNEQSPSDDLPPDLYQRGFACNTFRDLSRQGKPAAVPATGYVRTVVDYAASASWSTLGSFHEALTSTDHLAFKALDAFAAIDSDIRTYLVSGASPSRAIRPGSTEESFRRRRLQDQLLELHTEGHERWPPDLFVTAAEWLGPTISDTWNSPSPIARLLQSHLPENDHDLDRLLFTQPTPPPELLAAAVARVALALQPPALPAALHNYCAHSTRADNTAKAVVSKLLDYLPAQQRDAILIEHLSPAVASCIFDIVTAYHTQAPEKVLALNIPLAQMLSRVLSSESRDCSLEAKAALLDRHAAVADLLAGSRLPTGLDKSLDNFFTTALATEYRTRGIPPGKLLADSGKTRVPGLLRWTAYTNRRGHYDGQLDTWKQLHDAIVSLARAASETEKKAFPKKPPAELLDRVESAFEALGLSLERGSPMPRSTLLSASLTGLGIATDDKMPPTKWLRDRIDSRVNGRRDTGKTGSPLRTARTRRLAIGGAVLFMSVVVISLVLWSTTSRAPSSSKSPTPTREPTVGSKGVPKAPAGPVDTGNAPPTVENTHSSSAAITPPPGLTNSDLAVTVKSGTIELTCHAADKLKNRPWSVRMKPPTPTGTTGDLVRNLSTSNTTAAFDTAGGGFGDYVFSLTSGTSPVLAIKHTLPPPRLSAVGCVCTVVPSATSATIRVSEVPPFDIGHYGRPTYSLRYDSAGNAGEIQDTANVNGDLEFSLAGTPLRPAHFRDRNVILRLTISTPTGKGPTEQLPTAVNPNNEDAWQAVAPSVPDDSPGKDFLKHRVFPLPETYPNEPVVLCTLPWQVDPSTVSFCLLAPTFSESTIAPLNQLSLGDAQPFTQQTGVTQPVVCNAMDNAHEGNKVIEVGRFRVSPESRPASWCDTILFDTGSARDNDKYREKAYGVLRRCMLGIRINGKMISSHQLASPEVRGPITIAVDRSSSTHTSTINCLYLPALLELQVLRVPHDAFPPGVTVGPFNVALKEGYTQTDICISSKTASLTSMIIVKSGSAECKLSLRPFKWSDDAVITQDLETVKKKKVDDLEKCSEDLREIRDAEEKMRRPRLPEKEKTLAINKRDQLVARYKKVTPEQKINDLKNDIRIIDAKLDLLFAVLDKTEMVSPWAICWDCKEISTTKNQGKEETHPNRVVGIVGTASAKPVQWNSRTSEPSPTGEPVSATSP